MVVKEGDKVKVDYTGTFEDGTVFDSSEKHKQPLQFEVGGKQVIPGFEKALVGMKVGDEKDIKLQPDEAYGQPKPDLLKKVDRTKLPKEPEPKPGMLMGIKTPDGQQFPAKVVEVTDKEITIDLNHPLSGKILNFKLKLVEILKE